tara:strand:- start:300 stop:737 length:438 start_codon:yes stop_codon:yes gene_type:complete
MLSLIGSLLGFGTSFLPKVLSFFEEKRDQAHELKLMDKQLEQQIKLGEQKLQFINVDADIRETEALQKNQAQITMKSSTWVVNLSATVRPVMTYLLFIEFMVLTFMLAFNWIDLQMYDRIWSNEIQAVWAAVVSFWFGQRSFNRK